MSSSLADDDGTGEGSSRREPSRLVRCGLLALIAVRTELAWLLLARLRPRAAWPLVELSAGLDLVIGT